MSIYLQPCDWIEHDINYKYVVDAFGRTQHGDVARVRITGFKPYLYLRADKDETSSTIQNFLKSLDKPIKFASVSLETKQDAMKGFVNLQTTRVWKIECKSLWEFKSVAKGLRSGKIGTRKIQTEDIYEADLPPLLRFFHERDISPASPIEFEDNTVEQEEGFRADVAYEAEYDTVSPYDKMSIPLLVGSYDLEVYSSTGQFPVSSNPGDEITQIGLSLRWNDSLLQSEARYVFVNGSCESSKDPSVTFIPCKNEKDLLQKFEKCIHDENPDILIGYNTFGFDDAYIADRATKCGISLEFGRVDVKQWGDRRENVKTEKKTFELAAGKFAVRYIAMPGRQNLDLYLSMRREQNLDSYKLDNVANKFLRDKVMNVVEITGERTQMYEIHTKSTRGLFAGNLVRFDIVANTMNPYKDGKKVFVKEVHPKKFIVELPHADYLFTDLDESQLKKLEWSFAKDDVDHHEIFRAHVGSDADRSNIAKYCIQDCDLVLTLVAKLDTLVNARGMADVCRVPVDYIFIRGQGIKIYSAVVYNASKRNQIIMTQDSVDGDTSYEGAIVLPPKIGMYLDQPIPVLDFNSLYPSNMIAYNLSPDTLVYVKKYNCDGKRTYQWPNEIPATEFKVDEISYDERDDDGNPIGRVICGFAQPRDDGSNTGLLPLTLDILLKKRKETRKKMEQTEDDAQKSVLNGLQLAYKVVANSVYGQCGSKTSAIRNLYVAACTTALGRNKIKIASDIVVGEFGAEVVYGDSVASYTPLMLRVHGVQTIMSVEELGRMGEWTPCLDRDKEYCTLNGIESWTETGWVSVDRVIRHALVSHKKMIRILTHTGLVDVTDDHSLLRPDGTEVSSNELNIGDSLLHSSYPTPDTYTEGDVDKARIAGFFVGDGSCGVYNCPSGEKSSWALNNANIDVLVYYKALCLKVYPVFDWVINPTLVSSGVFKLVPISNEYGSLKKFIQAYRDMYYVDKRKNIPSWILNGSIEVQRAFWDGFYDADGDKDMNGYVRIDQKHQTTCAQLAFLGSRFGYNVFMNTRIDKLEITRLTFTKNKQRLNPVGIKKMYEIPYSGYVYDLTTSNHHFQAGVGQMIVHNTDSIFVKFPTKNLAESIKLGQQAAELITSRINRRPYRIEYEKTLFPFILFCRKRYVGMLYEDDANKKPKRKEMGIALKRRDSAPIVKDIFGGALDILMEERDIRKAQRFVNEKLVDVLQNKVPLDKFIITKQLGADYKNPEQLAHVVLANRMKDRDPGSAPQVGDRIPFLYVNERKQHKKQGDRIEHLDYVRQHKLTPDAEFYTTNQIQNPVAQMFALALEKLEGYKQRINYAAMLRTFMEDGMDEEEATLKVLDKKEKELDELMFQSVIKKYRKGPMDAFLRR